MYRDIGKEVVKIFGYIEGMNLAQSIIVAVLMLAVVCLAAALVVFLYVRVHSRVKEWRTRISAMVAGLCLLIGVLMLVFPHLFGIFANMADQSGSTGVMQFAFVVLIFVPMMLIGEYATDVLMILPTLICPVFLVASVILWIKPLKKSFAQQEKVPEQIKKDEE
ncbi:MAG: hypothetical protein IIW17_02400 [Clostridia bacterium]|nr:hypothetical protein [Clostridia bacterium]